MAVVLATALFGFQHGMLWAFVTGMTVNLLGFDPLGSVPLALLVVSAVVAGGDRLFGRLAWVFPIAAALVGSALYDLVLLVVFALLGQGLDLERSVSVVAAAAALNAVLAGVLLVPARLVAARVSEQQNPTW